MCSWNLFPGGERQTRRDYRIAEESYSPRAGPPSSDGGRAASLGVGCLRGHRNSTDLDSLGAGVEGVPAVETGVSPGRFGNSGDNRTPRLAAQRESWEGMGRSLVCSLSGHRPRQQPALLATGSRPKTTETGPADFSGRLVLRTTERHVQDSQENVRQEWLFAFCFCFCL